MTAVTGQVFRGRFVPEAGVPVSGALLVGLALVVSALVVLGGSSARPARLLSVATPPGHGLELLPLSARSAVSATLGAESSVFPARRSGGGYRLGGGGVAADLSARGVSFRADGVSLGMTLAGVGRGSRLERPGVATVSAHGNRVLLGRAGLSEWYAAGPLGIEQGFTLSRRPAGSGPVTLALQLTANARAYQAGSGMVSLSRPGQASLSYGALSATDANGRPLRAALAVREGRLLIRVADGGGRYPLRIDPLIQQGAKLTGSGATGAGRLGISAALSADGNTALVGGPIDNAGVGAAWVFTRTGGVWTQQGAKLTGGGETGNGVFGSGVALSADGNTALIGAPDDNVQVGAAWVFTRTAGVWTQQGAKLTGGGEIGNGGFGIGVALSADGNSALIGGYLDNGTVGAAWVFTRSGGVWSQQGSKLTGSGAIGTGNFGQSVALSADGNTALIGGTGDNGSVGAAWVFTRSGVAWTQQGPKLTGSGETGTGYFAVGVALSADGNTALVGGFIDNSQVGAAWVFTRSGGVWTQQGAKLTGSGETGTGEFGRSVALSTDGNTALIGGPGDNGSVGAAWVFTRSGGVWTQQGVKLTGSGEIGSGLFGQSAALSADGTTALIGGPLDNGSVGAAWVFVATDVPATRTCTRTVTGTVVANINVLSGTTCLKDLTMQGSVTVAPGAALSVINATIGGGSIWTFAASAITICDSRIGGSVNVLSSTGYVLIGDGGDGPAPPNNCSGNIFGGTVTLLANTGGLEVGGNTLGSALFVVANTGSLPIEDKGTEIEGNTINGNLICLGNAPAPTNDTILNKVLGSRAGQCLPPFV